MIINMETAPTTMLISLNFAFGKSGGKDKEITTRICTETGAQEEDLYAYKRTVCKEAYAPLKSLQSEWKGRLRRIAPPFDIPSTFLCKPMNVAKAMVLRDEYDPALTILKESHLIERYDHWKELTRSKTRGAFIEDQFPSVEEFRESVTWRMDVMPLSDGEAMRRIKDLGGDDIMDALTASHNERVQRGIKSGMAEAFTALITPLQHMVDTLKKPDKIIRESLVDNVRKVIAEIPGLNLTDDPELTRFATESEALLASLDTDSLRESPVVRQETADKGEFLLATFGSLSRKFAA